MVIGSLMCLNLLRPSVKKNYSQRVSAAAGVAGRVRVQKMRPDRWTRSVAPYSGLKIVVIGITKMLEVRVHAYAEPILNLGTEASEQLLYRTLLDSSCLLSSLTLPRLQPAQHTPIHCSATQDLSTSPTPFTDNKTGRNANTLSSQHSPDRRRPSKPPAFLDGWTPPKTTAGASAAQCVLHLVDCITSKVEQSWFSSRGADYTTCAAVLKKQLNPLAFKEARQQVEVLSSHMQPCVICVH